jgi:hypothetical protein
MATIAKGETMPKGKPYVLTMRDGSEWRTVCRVVRKASIGPDTWFRVRRWDGDAGTWEDVLAVWDDDAGAYRGQA